ncbi:MAG: STAS domain-containing protein [Conexibacter sp.]
MSVADVDRFPPYPSDFKLVVARRCDYMLVCPEGELDIATVDAVRAEVLALAVRGCTRIVLDLSRLRFVDSCQIHLLLELQAAAALDGFDLAVRLGDATPARRLLALAGLDERFALA